MPATEEYQRSFALEDISIRSGAHEDGRTVEAYAAVFDVPTRIRDQDGEYEEVIARTAFDKAITDAAPRGNRTAWRCGVLYNHGMNLHGSPSDAHSVPIGVCLDMKADSRGVLTVTRYHRAAEPILEAIREGSISAYSFSGAFMKSTPESSRTSKFRRDAAGRLPTVRRLESTLREYGPTPFPAYADAVVVGMRAEQIAARLSEMTPEERERLAELLTAELSTRTEDSTDAPDVDTSTEEAVTGEPQLHSTRYHQNALYKLRSKELYEQLGIQLPNREESSEQ